MRTTIDEAIAHARKVAKEQAKKKKECACQHEKLAEWLQELKAYRAIGSLADVAPIRHGRWNIIDNEIQRRECSLCHWDGPKYVEHYSWCPHCGAKMDRDAE